jgi:hypothetical protein
MVVCWPFPLVNMNGLLPRFFKLPAGTIRTSCGAVLVVVMNLLLGWNNQIILNLGRWYSVFFLLFKRIRTTGKKTLDHCSFVPRPLEENTVRALIIEEYFGFSFLSWSPFPILWAICTLMMSPNHVEYNLLMFFFSRWISEKSSQNSGYWPILCVYLDSL